jgi:hypothetical protein
VATYVPAGADEVTLEVIGARTQQILEWQRAEDRRRMWGLVFTIGGALFAAVKLGVIVVPRLRRRQRAHALGELAASPAQRRSRRRQR